ncbi:hypothetical protein CRI77_26600 [Mycolicibacterium duvalii]|uniref:Uncharacterized protein n=1 Tax=Mycolicibacterium duvalii TaxID=39688 RepID=A0A7I7K8M1_9MYCO|nr:hypothetical protein [Mycolicibacterium duvalii]MCV7370442.1 hypothetical protein [Mycolicibacterium duvalii]PEG34764.1 hypothetical protein CRI77_26600 [Mycolicibacterium duvalii]BBX20403.1 hypothetical protein MDUV_52630 [Mycolicibacterium duvalii]
MAFKLTYSDGQESQHDDDTIWEIDDGVLKLGRKEGEWSVLLSPSHWAVLEFVASSKDGDSDDGDSDDDDSDDDGDSDDEAKSDGSESDDKKDDD